MLSLLTLIEARDPGLDVNDKTWESCDLVFNKSLINWKGYQKRCLFSAPPIILSNKPTSYQILFRYKIIFYEWLCQLVSFLVLRKKGISRRKQPLLWLFSNWSRFLCLDCIFFVTSSHALVKCCNLKLFVCLAVLPRLFLVKLKLFVSLALLPSSSTALFLVTEALFCVDPALFSAPECLFCELADSDAVVKFPFDDAFSPSWQLKPRGGTMMRL